MSAQSDESSRKRRRDGVDHKPTKKLKPTSPIADVKLAESHKNGSGKDNKSNGEELANGDAHKEETKKSKSKSDKHSKKTSHGKDDRPKKSDKHIKEDPEKESTPRKSTANDVSIRRKSEHKSKKRKGKEESVNEPDREDAIQFTSRISDLGPLSKDKTLVKKPTPSKKWSWSLSQSYGGRFAPIDPVFSVNEKYMLLCTGTLLNVYSTATSLLVRRIQTDNGPIVGIKISPLDPDTVYVASSSGVIQLWNWLEGESLLRVQDDISIYGIDVAVSKSSPMETVFYIGQPSGEEKTTSFYSFSVTSRKPSAISLLHSVQATLRLIQVLNSGSLVLATADQTVVAGVSSLVKNGSDAHNKQDPRNLYSWKSMDFPEGLGCFNAREVINPAQKKANTRQNTVSVAFGTILGKIYVYDDILQAIQDPSAVKPRLMHWHRTRIEAVKWSLDGNYVISGGSETVLMLWQVETNKRQTLPHLTATIKRITVSPTGASYAVLLDDNSVLVLSTSELAPTAMVGGLQSLGFLIKTTLRRAFSGKSRLIHATPAVASGRFPNQLLLAVPANGGADSDQVSMPFIQAYDWAVGRHVSRQALARNNATNINVGPGGVPIKEAHITHLSISPDGEWLVSAETWHPEITSKSSEEQSNAQRRETFLKFWQWSTAQDQWILQTRIDAPHQSDTLDFANLILDLTANPESLEFTSIGQDGIVRVWSPKTRLSDGTIIRGVNPKGTTTWVASQVIDICKLVDLSHPDTDSQFSGISSVGKVAYSDDGSVLAATVDEANTLSPGLVHFIDVKAGFVRSSQPLIYGTGLGSIKFLGRYLIVLSTELRVWDIVANKLVFGFPHINSKLPIACIQTLSFIAVSSELGRFAVAFPSGQTTTRIAVFDPASPRPLVIENIPTHVTSLIALGGSSGFAAIDLDAQIRIIKPDTGSTFDALKLGMVMESESQDIDMIDALETTGGAEDADEEDAKKDEADDSDDNDDIVEHKPTVKPHQLAEIFDQGPAFALPPVEDLFRAVAGLYLGRPNKRRDAGAIVVKS